jgi:outer membrane immunogenic protein
MIKRSLVVGTVLTCLVAGAAVAADMPMKAAPYHGTNRACANFGGFYLGGQVGSAHYTNNWNDLDRFGPDSVGGIGLEVQQTGNGGAFGLQAGYNMQSGCTVFGVETDWAWTNAKASTLLQGFPGPGEDTLTATSKLRWFGTTRLRTGVVVDNLLLYVTGGVAYANVKRDTTWSDNGDPDDSETFTSSKTKFGWTAGVGTEWAINQNWSIKSEALYMQFQKDTVTHTSQFLEQGEQFRLKHEDSVWVARVGLNYRFGGY